MNYLDYIIEGLCFLLCVVHLLHNFVSNRNLKHKIDGICSICGASITEGDKHKCDLTEKQLNALYDFVVALKNDGGDTNVK